MKNLNTFKLLLCLLVICSFSCENEEANEIDSLSDLDISQTNEFEFQETVEMSSEEEGGEFSNPTAIRKSSDPLEFDIFRRYHYKGDTFTRDTRAKHQELGRILNKETIHYVVVQDLKEAAYYYHNELYNRANAAELKPKGDIVYIFDSLEEADTFNDDYSKKYKSFLYGDDEVNQDNRQCTGPFIFARVRIWEHFNRRGISASFPMTTDTSGENELRNIPGRMNDRGSSMIIDVQNRPLLTENRRRPQLIRFRDFNNLGRRFNYTFGTSCNSFVHRHNMFRSNQQNDATSSIILRAVN